jgi:hypothetical protein
MKQLSEYVNEKLVINKEYKNPDDLETLNSFLEPIYDLDWKYEKNTITGNGCDTNIKYTTDKKDVYATVLNCFITISKKYRSTSLVKCYVYYSDEHKRIYVIFDRQKGNHVDDIVDFRFNAYDRNKYNIVFAYINNSTNFRKSLKEIDYKHFKMPIAAIINVCETLKIGYWSNT